MAPKEGGEEKFKMLQENPKREGSASFDRYEAYKKATTLSEFLALGGSRGDYRNDTQKGYIIFSKGKKPPQKKKSPQKSPPPPKKGESPKKKKQKTSEKTSFVCSVEGRIEDWDDETFVDCRPTERKEAERAHEAAVEDLAKRVKEEFDENATMAHLLAALEAEIECSSVFTPKGKATQKETKGGVLTSSRDFYVDCYGSGLENIGRLTIVLLKRTTTRK